MSDDTMARSIREMMEGRPAPAPSDVKGEGHPIGTSFVTVSVPAYNELLQEIKELKSRASLTPLTDPSVRGVLVEAAPDDITNGAMIRGEVFRSDLADGKFVKAVPASEFGVAGGERIKELEELSNHLFNQFTDSRADAERLRKAIEMHKQSVDGCNEFEDYERINATLYAALSPSPAAASGEKQTESAVGAGGAGEISGSPKVAKVNGAGLIANLPNVEQTATTSVPTSAPAAESEGGETTEVERLEQCIEVYERSCTQWAEQCHGLITEREALSARIAACEERCKAVVGWAQGVIVSLRESGNEATAAILTKSLDSVLAPKAGGEQS